MDNLLKETNYADLDQDFQKWDGFIDVLRKSPFLSYFKPGDKNYDWDAMTPEHRIGIFTTFQNLHEKIFKYSPMEIEAGHEYSTPGLWATVSRKADGTLRDIEGGIHIPMMDGAESLQLLIYSMARNFLVMRAGHEDPKYAHLTDDVELYNTQKVGLDEELVRLGLFPMPSEFDQWLDRSSARYALQAASYVSGQLLGEQQISPKIIEILHDDFVSEHKDILAMVQMTHDQLDENVVGIHLEMWKMRAQDYINVIVANPDRHDPMEALRVLSVAKKSGITLEEPAGLAELLARDPNLKAMKVSGREEALDYVMKHGSETFQQLSTEARLHVIDMFGEQKTLSLIQRKACDGAAQELLRSWPLSQDFLQYYRERVKAMGDALRENETLNKLGFQWILSKSPVARLAFLTLFGSEVSKFLGGGIIPILPFAQARRERKLDADGEIDLFGERDALGFASQFANAQKLKEEYNITLPKNLQDKPVIGLNIHPDFNLLNALLPLEACQVIVHEYGHHEVDSFARQLTRGEITPADPRYIQAKEYETIEEKSHVDRRLRDEFSRALYPFIQTEKFEYWLMDELARCQPFGWLDLDS